MNNIIDLICITTFGIFMCYFGSYCEYKKEKQIEDESYTICQKMIKDKFEEGFTVEELKKWENR